MTSTNGHGPKRAILYARVSTDEQARTGYSLAQQIEALREYAAREGYEVLEEVQDAGQSGASLERPGMDRVRDLVAAGGVSVVLAQDRDRFAREPAYHYLLRREFEEHGTKIRALNDRGDESPGRRAHRRHPRPASQVRAGQDSREDPARQAEEGARGQDRGRGTRPTTAFATTTTRDGYEVDEEKMAVVRRIFRDGRRGGQEAARRKKTLDREGVPTPGRGALLGQAVHPQRASSTTFTSHTPTQEVGGLVAPEVAARLDPERRYGVWWYNRHGARRRARSPRSAPTGGTTRR